MQALLVARGTSHTQQTELSQKVNEWQESLRIELAQQVKCPSMHQHVLPCLCVFDPPLSPAGDGTSV